MELGWHSDFMSLCWMVLFISHLNSLISGFLLYILSLAVLLNSWSNSSIVFPPCSSLFNSTTLVAFYLLFWIFLLSLLEIPLLSYIPNSLISNLLIHFIFTYLLILPVYKINSETFSYVLSNTCGFVTSVLAPKLGLDSVASTSYATSSTCSCPYIATSYSYYY